MATKHHIKQRPLVATFAADVFKMLLQEMNREKLFLTKEDVK
jgi:hypothetical protein